MERALDGALEGIEVLNGDLMTMQDPVFRELYSEKRVVLEERRARVDNAPLGKFLEGFHQRAYSNNYG